MYKKPDKEVMTFMDFDQSMGLEKDSENRWVKLAELVPCEEFEEKYAALFRKRITMEMLQEVNERMLEDEAVKTTVFLS